MKLLHRYIYVFQVLVLCCSPILIAQTDWSKNPSNPIFGPGVGWESGVVASPTVIKNGDTLKMWYAGSTSIFSPSGIGYAWSSDGISWTRYAGNPVMTGRSGEWDNQSVALPVVLLDGDTLRMWYAGGGQSPDNFDIGYAVSVDGINWTRFPVPALQRGPAGEWNADILTTGTVIKENNLFKIWFTGGTGSVAPANQNTKTSIGYATSADGLNWTIYDDPHTTSAPYEFSDPVLRHGDPGEWDTNETFSASVIKTSGTYQLWYSGWIAGSGQHIGFATSPDGVQWTKYEQNPVMNAPGTWTNMLVFPSVILDNNEYRMLVQGWQQGSASIGYATSATTHIDGESQGSLNNNFNLHQNFPNPFNPSTRIQYQVTNISQVSLKIYDLLGIEVATLVNEEKPTGTYEVMFDASGLSSGIYFYEITSGSYYEVKKMALAK